MTASTTLPLEASLPSDTGAVEIVVTIAVGADPVLAMARLHRHLAEHLTGAWAISVLDDGRNPAVGVAFDGVRVVRMAGQQDRRALRRAWSSSTAATVAFAEIDEESDLDAMLAPLTRELPRLIVQHRSQRLRGPIGRRTALVTFGAVGLGAVLAACGANSSTAGSPTTTSQATTSSKSGGSGATSTSTTVAGAAATTVLAPEMTEGPYYLDLNLVRSDITEDRAGAPVTLNLVVVDASSSTPIENAAVDIWHADGDGLYSGFVSASAGANGGTATSDDGTFLRGTQLSDAAGKLTFKTIYPGWYSGRTVHIHVMVHVGGNVIHTGQLFFDDDFTDTVFASTAPYAARGDRSTRNSDDNIYGGGGSQSTLAVSGSGGAYTATMTMGVASS